MSTHRHRTALRVAALSLLLASCGAAEAVAPAPASEPVPARPATTTRAPDRPGSAEAAPGRSRVQRTLPDLVGLGARGARTRLAGLDVQVQAVAFASSSRISAQYPPAGAPVPADGIVTVWLGTPPEPPPPPEPTAEPSDAPPEQATDADAPGPAGGETEAPDLEPAEVASTAEPASSAAAAEPAPAPAAAQTPPRVNPRQRDVAEAGLVLSGPASWYGAGFAGRQMACGQPFDPTELTLASRELRCGTVVRITGASGKTVEATVTDWGPAEWTGRRFDLSQATFAAIASPSAGVTQITLEVIGG